MEHCQICKKGFLTVYDVSDKVWKKISPEKSEGGTLCIECADKRARKLGIDLFWVAKENEYEKGSNITKKLKEALKLRKAKYIKRWKGRDGKWYYQYKEEEKKDKKINVKKVVNDTAREFKISIMKFLPKNMTGEQKIKLKEMDDTRSKILTDILNGVNNNRLISFEGRGLLSGLDEYYRLVGYNIKTGEVEIKKKRSNKIFTKRVEDLLEEREKYNIKKLSKAFIFRKAKYIKRWKGKDGKWHYSYSLKEAKRIKNEKKAEVKDKKDIKSKLNEEEIFFLKKMKTELRRNRYGVLFRTIGIKLQDVKKKLPYIHKYLLLDHLKNTGVGVLNKEGEEVFRTLI